MPAAVPAFRQTASHPSSPRGGSGYRPDIDGLRAVAVLAVVGFHAAPGMFPGGFVGVDIFFAISGFLISSIILGKLANGDFSMWEFYARRVKRLFPALVLVLVASLVAGWFLLLADEYSQLGKHVAAGAAFSSNFILWGESGYFDNAAATKVLLHLWSLGIEEQFYIWWPLTLWWAWRKRLSLPVVAAAIALVSFAASIVSLSRDPAAAFYLPFGRAWELLAGALLAHFALNRGIGQAPSGGNAKSLVGALLIAIGFIVIDSVKAFPGWWVLLPVVGTTLMMAAGPEAWLNRHVLSSRLLVWFGLISFPLYLWHWPILSFLRILEGSEIAPRTAAVAVVASILLAWLTYEFIEKPVRNSAHTKFNTWSLVALMCLVGVAGWCAYARDGFPDRRGASPETVNVGDIGHAPFFDYIRQQYFACTPVEIQRRAEQWNGMPRCFQSKESGTKDVAILGDSHAEYLFAGLARSLPESNVVFYGRPDLPFVRKRQFQRIFEYVLDDRDIKVVVLSARWPVKLREYSDDRLELELAETVKALTASGKQVVLVTDVPTFSFNPERCKYAGRLGQKNKCSEVDRRAMARYMPALEALEAESVDFRVVRAHDFFCLRGSCSMAGKGVLYYRDDNHLNVAGSTALASVIVAQMRQ